MQPQSQLPTEAPAAAGSYRSLDAEQIIRTIRQLTNRIVERFPGSGLSRLSSELLQVSVEAAERAAWIRRPNLPLRIGVGLLIAGIVAVVMEVILRVRVNSYFSNFADLIQATEATFNLVLLSGAGIFFLVSLEIRMKRQRALRMLHELRVLAHLTDMHQLTKDPERLFNREHDTASSPVRTMTPFELSRYLDYCSEMLSLIGKIAALYAQYFDDRIILEAVDEVEDLSTSLARKIWQKIMMLNENDSAVSAQKQEIPPGTAPA